MDWERMASIGVAALCMTALGVAATTFDSTVSQTPDDVVDFGDTQLPFGDESTGEVDQQIERNKQSQGDDGGGSGSNGDESSSGGAGDQRSEPADDSGDEKQGAQPSDSGSQGTGPGEQSLLQRLLDLLRQLLPLLVALVVLALAYRYRDRLLALLAAPLALLDRGGDRERNRTDRDPWAEVDPGDQIDRAWYAMVRQLDVDRPWTKTPDECRSAAVEAGLDPEAVGTLTRLFRRNRFAGDGPPPADRERATECLKQLGLGGQHR